MSEAQAEVSLFDQATLIDPYAAYKTLRDQAPVHFEPGFGAYVVTRYDLIREAIRDTATYSSEFGDFLDGARKILFQQAPSGRAAEADRVERADDLPAADHADPR